MPKVTHNSGKFIRCKCTKMLAPKLFSCHSFNLASFISCRCNMRIVLIFRFVCIVNYTTINWIMNIVQPFREFFNRLFMCSKWNDGNVSISKLFNWAYFVWKITTQRQRSQFIYFGKHLLLFNKDYENDERQTTKQGACSPLYLGE